MAQDRWLELCELVKDDDGLPVRECGAWTEEKLHLWSRYLDITTGAMVDNPRWNGLAYIDLFAGPGICRIKDSGKRLPGSPLIAANTKKHFERIVCVELDSACAAACQQRLSKTAVADRTRVLQGDCTNLIASVVKELPSRALTLAFIDPEGLDVDFQMLSTLADSRRVDFLLLFADAIDLVRNIDLYKHVDSSKLDRMLGPGSNWREQYEALPNPSGPALRALFPKIYESQIQRLLGYKGLRQSVIEGPRGPLYRMLYASKHERGLEFFDKIAKLDHRGQGKLF